MNFATESDNFRIQSQGSKNDLEFKFTYQGGTVETLVYDATQFRYKKYMAPVIKVDTTKSIMSPMPGKVLSVSVKVGDEVEDG